MYIKKLKIGNVELDNNVFLAPMAGITDKSFRKIVKEYGNPGLTCTEMSSAKAVFYKDSKTEKLMNTDGEKKPIAVQIFGSDLDSIRCAVKTASEYGDIIDINMGCPAPKVVKNGDGSKLLLNLKLIEQIVKIAVISTNKPVTIKIRKGWDSKNVVAVEVAQIAEKAGASAITIHGRTREEYYSGKIDLDVIKNVKDAVKIPVIGNGDIKDKESAKKMFEYTGVDGIMVGRANLGTPWFTNRLIKELNEQYYVEPTNKDKLDIIIKHLEFMIEDKNEYVGIREMRKHICWYLKNIPNSAKARNEINTIEDKITLENYLRRILC